MEETPPSPQAGQTIKPMDWMFDDSCEVSRNCRGDKQFLGKFNSMVAGTADAFSSVANMA
jgi:hypothetical protein